MMNRSNSGFLPHSRRSIVTFAITAMLMSAGSACAQSPTSKTTEPPAADGSRPTDKHAQPASDPELRKRARELLVKGMDSRKRELEAIEKALQLFDQGKTWEEIRELVPELPRFGLRSEDRERWNGRQSGNEDVNRLGGPGGMPQGGGPGMPPPGKGPDAARALTEEDRNTVREVLAATAPETLKRLRELEKSEPAKAEQQYQRSLDRMRFLIDLRKRDRPMFDLKAQDIRHAFEAGALARSIAEIDKSPTPDTAERQKKVELLRTALLAQYDIRTKIMQREIDRSSERATEMAKEIEKRPAQAAEVVDKNIREMIDREHRRRERMNGDGGRGDRHTGEGKPPEPQQKQ